MIAVQLPLLYSGKGKTMFRIPGHKDLLLQVCRDTLSTHNVVHATEVPGKGAIIAAQTLFMHLNALKGVETHIVAFGRKIYDYLPRGEYPEDLHLRSFVVKKAEKPDFEFIVRAYNAGSLEKTLRETGTNPYGLRISADFPKMGRFPFPVFTPTEKSDDDLPRDASEVRGLEPVSTAIAIDAFILASEYLRERGVTLIDAKFELNGRMLIDDWLNGDCARMALTSEIQEGKEPPWLDKETFRNIASRKWDVGPKVPLSFSQEENEEGLKGYHEAFTRITGMTLLDFQEEVLNR